VKHELLLLLDFKLLDEFKGSSLVIAHVLIPCLRELLKLEFLSTLDIDEFFFLSQTHVLLLTLLLGTGKLFESKLHHLGTSVVTVSLGIDS